MSRGGHSSWWRALGVGRDADAAEIRRAYARKLKATDVDADPAAFVALRQAFDRGLADAARRTAQGEEPPPSDWDIPLTQAPDFAFSPAAAPDPPPAARPPSTDALPPLVDQPHGGDSNARFVALEQLLFPAEGAPPPDPAALDVAFRAIVDHPEMAHVDRSFDVEMWLAEVLYEAIPRSDPLIPEAIEHFGWGRKAGHWDQHWLFDELIRRRDAFRLLDEIEDPRHRYHKAWRDLTSDEHRLGLTTIARKSEVAGLLQTIREQAPAAEAWLNPRRVALWDRRLSGSIRNGLGAAAFLFWMLYLAVQFFSALSPSTPSTPPLVVPVSRYADPAVDLDPLIRGVSGWTLDLADLTTRNPGLHDRLLDLWRQARDRSETQDVFETDVRSMLDETVSAGLRGGSYRLQSDYWQLRLAELKWLRDIDVESCSRSVRGDATGRAYPDELIRRLNAIRARALAEAPRAPPPARVRGTETSFLVPGPVVEEMRSRSGLSQNELDQTFRNQGTDTQLCAARIALIEAAVALPERQGARLLRDMSRGL